MPSISKEIVNRFVMSTMRSFKLLDIMSVFKRCGGFCDDIRGSYKSSSDLLKTTSLEIELKNFSTF